jgi:hypothetical protein
VANVTVVSGTNRNPSPAPWTKPVTPIFHCYTFGFQPVMSYIAHAVIAEPPFLRGVDIKQDRLPDRNQSRTKKALQQSECYDLQQRLRDAAQD